MKINAEKEQNTCLVITIAELLIGNGCVMCVRLKSSIFKIGNTLNEKEFKEMIGDAIIKRQESILESKSMEIDIDPRIAEAINKSSMLSSIFIKNIFNIASKGRSHLLIKDPQRKSLKIQELISTGHTKKRSRKLRKK